jgi:cell division protein FtsW (lipid II flippase)
MKGCVVVLFAAVLRAMASCATEAASSYTSIVLCCMVVLVALKALCNIAATIEELAVMELAV